MKRLRMFWLIPPVLLAGLVFTLLWGSLGAQAAISIGADAGVESTTAVPFLHDFEAGLPDGFVPFSDALDGSGSTTTLFLDIISEPLPEVPTITENDVLSVTYDVAASGSWGGGPGYAGVTFDFSEYSDWSAYSAFSFWWYGGNTGGEHRIELKTGGADPLVSNRFVYTFADDFIGWKYFALPFDNFVKRTDYNPGADLGDALILDQMWGYSVLLSAGVKGTFYIDNISLTGYNTPVDFESGVPTGFVPFSDAIDGSGSTTFIAIDLIDVPLPFVPEIVGNTVLSVTYDVAATGSWGGGPGYAGVTHDFSETQDWTSFEGFSFWWSGGNTGGEHRIELKTGGESPLVSNRFVYSFLDDFSGWKYFTLPFDSFVKRTDYNPGAALGDTPALDQVWGYSVLLSAGVQGTFYFDQIAAYGGVEPLKVTFDQATYYVTEGGSATINVSLNMAATLPVTVTYATSDGSATSSDYLAGSGELVFAPGELTQSFSVVTVDDTESEDSETVNLALSAPQNAQLGLRSSAVLSIADNDQADVCLLHRVIVDDFESGLPSGTDGDGLDIGFVTWGDTWNGTTVAITTTLVEDSDPLAVPCQSGSTHLLQLDASVVGWGGMTHAFENETVDTWITQDWSSYEGVSFWVYGHNTGATLLFEIQDNRNPDSTTSDAEIWSYSFPDDFSGWKYVEVPFSAFVRKEIGNGAPNDGFGLTEVHAWAFGMLTNPGPITYYIEDVSIWGRTASEQPLQVSFAMLDYQVIEGAQVEILVTLNVTSTQTVTVSYTTEQADAVNRALAERDYTSTQGELVFAPGETEQTFTVASLQDIKYEGSEVLRLRLYEPQNAELGSIYRARLNIQSDDPFNPLLLDDFETYPYFYEPQGQIKLDTLEISAADVMALPAQGDYEHVLVVEDSAGPDLDAVQSMFGVTFSQAQDWSQNNGYAFWYYGNNSNETITVELQDNRALDPGPSGWELVWSDEFQGVSGTSPDLSHWTHEIGNGFDQAITGWGNGELQYYTASAENSALDGHGNLVITAKQIDPATAGLECWYGACEYTSARLISSQKFEMAYGRVEARMQLPYGPGLWPAFWMLGNNIGEVGWPTSGEIDIMENIGIEPDIVHGTIHGPGYSGGSGIGGSYTLDDGNFSDDFHVFAIEWEPGEIRWYVDGNLFLTITDEDIPEDTTWVFDHPFYLLMNVAVGGTWPGSPDETTTFPQMLQMDYVRVYQADDTAERFEASFIDDFTGWKLIRIPFASFERSATQLPGAPDDGLTLTEVWGHGFRLDLASEIYYFDQIQLFRNYLKLLPVIFK